MKKIAKSKPKLRTLAGRSTSPKRATRKTTITHKKTGKDIVKHTPKPRQNRLPGMEDSQIKDLEDAAIEHSEIRSEIVATRARLTASKATLTSLMKQNGKKTYNHNGIHVKLREGHDDVSVQVKRHDREDASEADEVEPEQEPDADPIAEDGDDTE